MVSHSLEVHFIHGTYQFNIDIRADLPVTFIILENILRNVFLCRSTWSLIHKNAPYLRCTIKADASTAGLCIIEEVIKSLVGIAGQCWILIEGKGFLAHWQQVLTRLMLGHFHESVTRICQRRQQLVCFSILVQPSWCDQVQSLVPACVHGDWVRQGVEADCKGTVPVIMLLSDKQFHRAHHRSK